MNEYYRIYTPSTQIFLLFIYAYDIFHPNTCMSLEIQRPIIQPNTHPAILPHTEALLTAMSTWEPEIDHTSPFFRINERRFRIASDYVLTHIFRLPYDEFTAQFDPVLRWQRDGARVWQDGYTIQGKDCADLTDAYLTLVRSLGYKGNHVKIIWEGKTKNPGLKGLHSLAEVSYRTTMADPFSFTSMDDTWHTVDVAPRGKCTYRLPEVGDRTLSFYPGYQVTILARGRTHADFDVRTAKDEKIFWDLEKSYTSGPPPEIQE